MSFKIKGLNEFQKELKKLSDNARNISKENVVSFDELFIDSFMQKFTKFPTINEFIEKSGFDFTQLELIHDSELDEFVNNNTNFSDWQEMLNEASELWTMRKLGL